MNRRIAVAFAFIGALFGCTTVPDVHRFGQIDPSDISITVPAGGAGVLCVVKQELQQAGWRLAIDDGPEEVTGTNGTSTHLLASQTFTTRYTLFLQSHRQAPQNCSWTTQSFWMDSSVVDNKTGREVFTVSGSVCSPEDAAHTLMTQLDGKSD